MEKIKTKEEIIKEYDFIKVSGISVDNNNLIISKELRYKITLQELIKMRDEFEKNIKEINEAVEVIKRHLNQPLP